MVDECSLLPPAISGYRSSRQLTWKAANPQARYLMRQIPELLWMPFSDETMDIEKPTDYNDGNGDSEIDDHITADGWRKIRNVIRKEQRISSGLLPVISNLCLSEIQNANMLDQYDPFQGNVVAVARLHLKRRLGAHQRVFMCICYAASESASELCIVFVDTKGTRQSHNKTKSTGLPTGPVLAFSKVDLGYPIRDICIIQGNNQDTAPNIISKNPLVIGIRTHCSTVLVNVQLLDEVTGTDDDKTREYELNVHIAHMHKPADYGTLDSSPGLPAAMCISPYCEFEYAIITENGNVVVFDSRIADSHSSIAGYHIEEDPVSTWQSIAFANDQRKLIVASSNKVYLIDLKVGRAQLLYEVKIDDRIYTMTTPHERHWFLYWVSTAKSILLLDIRRPKVPLACETHYMDDAPPTFAQRVVGSSADYLFLWARTWDYLMCVKYHRHPIDNGDELALNPGTRLLEMTPSIPFETVHTFRGGKEEILPMLGFFAMLNAGVRVNHGRKWSRSKTDSFIWFRLLQDGSVRSFVFSEGPEGWIKYHEYDSWGLDGNARIVRAQRSDKSVTVRSKDWLAGEVFAEVMSAVQLDTQSTSSSVPPLRVLLEENGSSTIPRTLNELLSDEGLDASICEQVDNISLEKSRIACVGHDMRQSIVPITSDDDPAETRLGRELRANRLTYFPEPDVTSDLSLRYLLPANAEFKPTSTVKYMASEWQPGLPADASIDFGWEPVDYASQPTQLLPSASERPRRVAPPTRTSKRVSISIPDHDNAPPSKKLHILSSQPPDTSFEETASPFIAIATQPVPGAFASRQPVKKKKKKTRTKGFK